MPQKSSAGRWSRPLLLLAGLVVSWKLEPASALGGEMATLTAPLMSSDARYRQDICDRFDEFRRTKNLRQGLSGMYLNIIIGAYEGAYFNYDEDTGINQDYPGMVGVLLDELGRRANFTWRQTFGIYKDPAPFNATWDELLLWSTDSFDVSADYWYYSLKRMGAGVAYVQEWHDSSPILIGKTPDATDEEVINPWNWLRPYNVQVWLVTLFTVLSSAVVYQVLEWYADDRQDRSMWDWWQENAYLSFINFTQAYEYQPKSFASRIFGISMAIWALVMTATYTANLASLLVDHRTPIQPAQSLGEVAYRQQKVCTWKDTVHDQFVRNQYPDVIRIPKDTPLDMYQGIQTGECDFLVDSVASWGKWKAMEEYNPTCDLSWVKEGVRLLDMPGAFTTSADSGHLCSGFIRDVLNIHMHDLIEDGFLVEAWKQEYERTETMDCDTYTPDLSVEGGGRLRKLRSRGQHNTFGSQHRMLGKAGGKGAASGAVAAMPDDSEAGRLKLQSMMGIFIFHWGLMFIALFIAVVNGFLEGNGKGKEEVPGILKDKEEVHGTNETRSRFFQHTQYQTKSRTSSDDTPVAVSRQEESNEEVQSLRDQIATMQNQLQRMSEQQEQSQLQQLAFQQQLLKLVARQDAPAS